MQDKGVSGVNGVTPVPTSTPYNKEIPQEANDVFETPGTQAQGVEINADDVAPVVQSEVEEYRATSIDDVAAQYGNYDTKIDLDLAQAAKYLDDTMSFDDNTLSGLEARREQISGNLETSQSDLALAYDGSHPKLKEAADALSDAQDIYDTALDDSKNPEIIAIRDEITFIEQNIGAQNEVIAFIETQISETTSQISEQNSAISAIESEISSYETQIANFKNLLSSVEDEQQKAALSALIQNLESAKGNAVARKTSEESVLDTLEDKLSALSEQKPDEEEKLENLIQRQSELEDTIADINDGTINSALTALNDAREQFETLQNELITTINSEISDCTSQLNDVDELIAALKEQIFAQEAAAVNEQLNSGEEITDTIDSTAYPSGGSGGSGGVSSGGAGTNTSSSSEKASDSVPLDKLKSNYEDADKKVDLKRKSKNLILKGQNEDLSAIKRVSNENYSKFSDELAKLNPELAASIDAIKTNLDEKEAQIDALDLQIAEFEEELSDLKTSLTGVNANISALNSAKESLDKVDKSKLDSENLKKYNEKKSALEAELKSLETKKTGLQGSIKEKESGDDYKEYKELVKQRSELKKEYDTLFSDLQSKINQATAQYPELKQLGDNYIEKSSEYKDTKEEKLSDINGEIKSFQAEADELYKTYAAADAKENAAQYAFSDGSIPSDLASALDSKLGAGFSSKVEEISRYINCDPKDLLGMMNSESGVNPQAVNGSSGATGLIQFMPSTAKGLGTTTAALKQMSAIEQLDYVKAYFGSHSAKMTAGDLYTQCFLPARVGKEVVCNNSDILAWAYKANPGFDTNKDGKITNSEMSAFVERGYSRLLKTYGLS